MSIEYIKGDLFNTECKYMAHGVNCQGVMGSGVAKIVRERFPESYEDYKQFQFNKLFPGSNGAKLLGEYRISPEEHYKHIVHFFTQEYYGYDSQRYMSYDAMYKAFNNFSLIERDIKSIAMPKIGAGLGGGDWNIIEAIIKNTLVKEGVKVYVYEL